MPTSYQFLRLTDGAETIIRAVLKSWTHPPDADPGPALIELNLGTAAERTDMCTEVTPGEARAIAQGATRSRGHRRATPTPSLTSSYLHASTRCRFRANVGV